MHAAIEVWQACVDSVALPIAPWTIPKATTAAWHDAFRFNRPAFIHQRGRCIQHRPRRRAYLAVALASVRLRNMEAQASLIDHQHNRLKSQLRDYVTGKRGSLHLHANTNQRPAPYNAQWP